MLEVYYVPSVLKQIDAIPVGAGFRGPGTSSACLVDLVLPFAAGLAFFERSCLRRRVCVLAVEWRFLPCYKLRLHLLFRPLAGP